MDKYGIAAFRSRQQVLLFDQALRAQGLYSRVVSSPPEVAQGCGLSVQFDLDQYSHVREVHDAMRLPNLIGFYRVDRVSGFQRPVPISGGFTTAYR